MNSKEKAIDLAQAKKEIAELWSSPSDTPTYSQIFEIIDRVENKVEDNWLKIESEKDLPSDAIKKETRFWLSLNKVVFEGYFYKAYGGLNYFCSDYEGLPKEVKGIHMGTIDKLDGYQPIIKPQPPIH